MKGTLFVVSAPSGTGKTTLCRRLLAEFDELEFSISCTTRAPREGEVNGRDYYFLSRDEFEKRIEQGDFLEWAEVYGHLYGTPKSLVLKALSEGKSILLDIDPQGALQVKKNYPLAVLVYILPPSLEELERRLLRRGKDSIKTIKERLSSVRKELLNVKNYDFILINDDIDRCYFSLRAIFLASKWQKERFFDSLHDFKNLSDELKNLIGG